MEFEGKRASSIVRIEADNASWDDVSTTDRVEHHAIAVHANAHIIFVSLPPALLEQRAAAIGVDVTRLELRRGRGDDQELIHIVNALALTANEATEDQTSVRERLVDALCTRLIADHTAASDAKPQELSLPQKRRIVEFIDARLADKLSLSQIAKVARLSPSHLKVLFRRTFGLPVHQYVIRRRVERAAQMIQAGAMPISDVAAAAGFAHQSHLARCMRRVLGTTPAALARCVR